LGVAPGYDIEAPAAADEQATSKTLAELVLKKPTLAHPYVSYLGYQELLEIPTQAQQIVHRSKAYMIINGELYNEAYLASSKGALQPRRAKASY
jgi:hypothetical protein